MPRVIEKISHLHPPPPGLGKIRFDRFSPYFERPAKFALMNVRPFEAYRYIYSSANPDSIRDIAYFFEAEYDCDADLDMIFERLAQAIKQWNEVFQQSLLCHFGSRDVKVVIDLRSDGAKMYSLSKLQSKIIEATESIKGYETVRQAAGAKLQEFNAQLGELFEAGLIVKEANYLLSLSNKWDEGFQMTEAQKIRVKELVSRMKTDRSSSPFGISVPRLADISDGATK